MNPGWVPVYVAHGSQNEEYELQALEELSKNDPRFNATVIRTIKLMAQPDGHIYYRNALLLTTALASFPGATAVAFGALLGEGSGDKSSRFVKRLERAWQASEGRRVRLLTPLARMTKATALRKALALPGGDSLRHTVSCYAGKPTCGKCQACFRRGIAEYLNGVGEMPQYPTETNGAWATLRAAHPTRWPALALANVDVLRAELRARRPS